MRIKVFATTAILLTISLAAFVIGNAGSSTPAYGAKPATRTPITSPTATPTPLPVPHEARIFIATDTAGWHWGGADGRPIGNVAINPENHPAGAEFRLAVTKDPTGTSHCAFLRQQPSDGGQDMSDSRVCTSVTDVGWEYVESTPFSPLSGTHVYRVFGGMTGGNPPSSFITLELVVRWVE